MKQLFLLCLLATVSCASVLAQDNTRNPRGIYKLEKVTDDKGKTTIAPFDQYKICTDSVTLMVTISGNSYRISDNDHRVFSYTGEEPATSDDHSTRIFDVYDDGFSLNWWGSNPNHRYYTHNGWTTERYQKDTYSEAGRIIFDALKQAPVRDKSNPLIGTWRHLGMMDELRNVKKEMKRIREEYPNSRMYKDVFVVLTPTKNVYLDSRGSFSDIQYVNKRLVKVWGKEAKVIWLSKDVYALEVYNDWRTDYQIFERVTDGTIPLQVFAGYYVKR